MQLNRVVLCMKWGALYGPDYVNVLFNACRKNISGDFRFVCLTDDWGGLLGDVEVYPIPEIGCTPEMWRHGAWPKLSVFSDDLYGLVGRALFIDMDTVICGSLDRFFLHPSQFVAIDTGPDWRPGGVSGGLSALVGTGVFAFNIGQQYSILSRFQSDPYSAFKKFDIEQVWVQKHASSVDYWPNEWVVSFKRWLRRPIGLDFFVSPRMPPKNASIVAFHGDPRPIALIKSGNRIWDKFPHFGRGQVGWMKDYWCDNGGKL